MINNLRAFQEVLKRNNLPTPDTYLGISELIRSLYRPDVTPNPERIREVLEELTWPVTVPAGNPITFKSCSEVLSSEALVTFAPKQSGTGDPSPENVRPISGRDSVDVVVTGKNLAKPFSKTSGIMSYDGNGNVTVNGTTSGTLYVPTTTQAISDGILYKLKAGTYIPSLSNPYPNNDIFVNVVSKDNVNLSQGNSFTLTEDTEVYVRVVIKAGTYNWTSGIQLELGSTKTAYEPYNSETHTATFPDTVYGGSYDFVSGKATLDKKFVSINGSENWVEYPENSGKFYSDTVIGVNEAAQVESDTQYISNMYKFKGDGSSSSTQITTDKSFYGQRAFGRFWVYDSDYVNDLVAFETMLNTTPLQICYPLATPQEITLTPEQIELLKGSNTVWTDGDTVQIKFQILK